MPTFVPNVLRRAFRRRDRRKPGLPPGLQTGVVDELCQRKLGASLRHSRHVHLSGWKTTGAYRLELTSRNGLKLSVIFKSALYHAREIPALEGFPVTPGFPERVVYGNVAGALAPYLPEVYACQELEPGRRYHYLLEDLSANCREPAGDDDLKAIVDQLGVVHDAMASWSTAVDTAGLLEYDHGYASGVWRYIEHQLRRYHEVVSSTALVRVIEQLVAMRDAWDMPTNDIRCQLVHGDLNVTNVWMGEGNVVRLVDWEWAGWAIPHVDLAAVLKHASPAVETELVDSYARRHPELELSRHRLLYQRCRLERGLVDAAFLAAQVMDAKAKTRLDVSAHVEKALGATLRVFAWMQGEAE